MAHTITVKELEKFCKEQVKNGNGNKKIMLSDDEEGNGYHDLFFAFTPVTKDAVAYTFLHDCSEEEALKDYIILG